MYADIDAYTSSFNLLLAPTAISVLLSSSIWYSCNKGAECKVTGVVAEK